MSDTWTMDEAQNNFAAIAQAAYEGHPQYIKVDDHPDLVISTQSTDKITERLDNNDNKNFVEFLLSAPQGDWELTRDNDTLKLRDVEF